MLPSASGRHLVSALSSAHKCDGNQVLSKTITDSSGIRPDGPVRVSLGPSRAVSSLRPAGPSRPGQGSALRKAVLARGTGVCARMCGRSRVDSLNRYVFNDHVMRLLFNASFSPTCVFFCSPFVYLTGKMGGGRNYIQRKMANIHDEHRKEKRNTRFIVTPFLREAYVRLVSDEFWSLSGHSWCKIERTGESRGVLK